jgi:biotin carboxylase
VTAVVVPDITETPFPVPVKMVSGASLTFNVVLPEGMDLPVAQVECRIYENTPEGFKGTPALVPTITKTAARVYNVRVSALESATLSVKKDYRWYFKRAVSINDTRHFMAGPWKVVAP